MRKLILIVYMFAVVGCVLPRTEQKILSNSTYKLDIGMEFEGNFYRGVARLPIRKYYDIKFKSYGKLNYFTFNTCSTDATFENAGGRIIKQKEVKLRYTPNQIENDLFCDVKISTVEKLKHRNTAGLIVFANPFFSLDALLICGGSSTEHRGVNVCRNRVGNYVRLVFKNPVTHADDPKTPLCNISITNKKVIEFTMRKGFCSYVFRDTILKTWYRLVTHGHDDYFVRGL